jgi:hypothetical protein
MPAFAGRDSRAEPPGVKNPEEDADSMPELKLRPLENPNFSAHRATHGEMRVPVLRVALSIARPLCRNVQLLLQPPGQKNKKRPPKGGRYESKT